MQTVGNYLKKEREARDISLSEVADCTKISRIYLDCLEKDDFAKIPGEPYVKGYISSYAECVGISELEALRLYESFQSVTDIKAEVEPEILKDKKTLRRLTKKTWFSLAIFILIILAMAAYYFFFQNQKKSHNDKILGEPNKTSQPAVNSNIESNFPQERQIGNSIQSGKQNEFEKKLESKEDRKNDDDGISQTPAPLESHRPTQDSKKGVLFSPFYESSKVRDLPNSQSDQNHFENIPKVIDAAACINIKNRIPQGSGHSFEWSIDKIYIWNSIECDRPPSSIRHIYYFEGKKVNDILLEISSSNWRTWSYKTLSNKSYIGRWRVDITSIDGKLLQSIEFEIR